MGLKRKIAFIVLYLLLFVVLSFVFLLFKFPYHSFIKEEIEKLARQANYQVDYRELILAFPPQAVFKDIKVQNMNILAPQLNEVLKLDSLDLKLSIKNFAKNIVVDFTANGYGGSVSGREIFNWPKNVHTISAQFNKLQLQEYPLWENFNQFSSLEGVLSGQFELESKALKDMTGELKLMAKKVKIKGIKTGGLFEELVFNDCRTQLSLSDNILKIKDFKLNGELFRIETMGRIPLAKPLEATKLNLPLKVFPLLTDKKTDFPIPLLQFARQAGSLTLYLNGTIRQPSISLTRY